MRTLPAVALLLLLASALPVAAAAQDAAPPAASSSRVRELVDRVLLAYGGRPALERVHAYRLEGDLFSAMRHSSTHTVRIFQRPDRFKVLIDYADGAEARVVDGHAGWRSGDDGSLEAVTGPMLYAMILQAARCDVPWILIERGAQAQLSDTTEVDGMRCAGIEIPLGEGLLFRAWVHPGNYTIVRSQGLLRHGGMSTHFETRYSDFREVHGLKFAFREENFASGVPTGVTTVRSVTLDPPIRKDEFAPPGATAAPKPGRGNS